MLSGAFAGCPEGYRTVEEDVREADAAIRITDFRRESVLTDGTKQWFVRAEEAFIYQNNKKTARIIAYNFRFEQYDAQGRPSDVITADRGEIDQDEEMFYLSGNVFFKGGEKNRTIRAEEVEYDRINQIMTSEKPLVIEEAGLVTRCTRGAEIDNAENRQICKGPVVVSTSTSGPEDSAGDLFQ